MSSSSAEAISNECNHANANSSNSTTNSSNSIMEQQEQPSPSRPAKQRRRLLIKEKAGILQWMETHKKTLEETCREFGLSFSTLAKWRMRRNEIIHQANSARGSLKSHHAPKFPQVEAKVLAWIGILQQQHQTDDKSPEQVVVTHQIIEQYLHQAKREVLTLLSSSADDTDAPMPEEEVRKKRKLERLSVSPEFVRNFMFRHGFPTSDQDEILSFDDVKNTTSDTPLERQQQNHQHSLPSTKNSTTSGWDDRIASIEQQWGVSSSNEPANRKEKIEAVERQVFGKLQLGTLEQRIQALE